MIREYRSMWETSKSLLANSPDSKEAKVAVKMMGATWISLAQLGDNYLRELLVEFEGLLEGSNGSPLGTSDSLHYWSGLARLFLQEYADARTHFSAVVDGYPQSEYHGESLFRLGVCAKALEEFQLARATFAKFMESHPGMKQVVEAGVFLGDMASAEEKWEEAKEIYKYVVFGIPYTTFPKDYQFISFAVFEAMAIIEKPADHEAWRLSKELLEDYISTHPGADHSRTQGEIARLEELLGDITGTLARYLETIRTLGGNKQAAGVDSIMHKYSRVYWKYRKQYDDTFQFLSKLSNDKAWRIHVLEDRDKLISSLVRYPALEGNLLDKFLSDVEFRNKALVNPAVLNLYLDDYRRKRDGFPSSTPLQTFTSDLQDAITEGKHTYKFRLLQFLDPLYQAKGTTLLKQAGYSLPRFFDIGDFQQASAGTLIWMAKYNLSTGYPLARQKAKTALAMIVDQFPGAGDAVLPALLLLAKLEAVSAESSNNHVQVAGSLKLALHYYTLANGKFPASGQARIGQADMFLALGELTKAVEVYRDILQFSSWKEFHAEGHFKVGLCYQQMDKTSMAAAFFQKTYVSFLRYAEWAAKAYLHHADCLEKLGKPQDARKVLEEAVRDPRIQKTKAYPFLQARL